MEHPTAAVKKTLDLSEAESRPACRMFLRYSFTCCDSNRWVVSSRKAVVFKKKNGEQEGQSK